MGISPVVGVACLVLVGLLGMPGIAGRDEEGIEGGWRELDIRLLLAGE